MSLPINPIAQSFVITSPADAGAFLSSIELYFKSVSNDPTTFVWLEIRNMVDGFPGTRVIPFSEVVLYGGTPTVYSATLNNPTKFTFPSPVYLKADQEYCFVVGASTPDYEIYTATLGEEGDTGEVVSKQPYIGNMFLSSNGATWNAAQDQDVTFRINRCSFTTGVSGTFNLRPRESSFTRTLPAFSVSTTSGSNSVVVRDPGHGLKVGDTFVITEIGGDASSLNGIPLSELTSQDSAGVYSTQTVTARDFDSYTFSTVSNATSTGAFGAKIKVRTHTKVDVLRQNLQYMEFPDASATFQLASTRWSDGVLVANQSTEPNTNIEAEVPQKVEYNDPTSFTLTPSITSNTDYLSPALDVKDAGIIAVANKINSIPDNDVTELAATGGDAIAKYLSKTINLKNSANSCTVFLVSNITFGTNIRVYFKGVDSLATDVGIENQPYIEMERVEPIEYDVDTEYTFRLPLDSAGVDVTDDFDNYKIKVVFIGDSDISTRVPTLSQFRAVATTV